MKAKELNELMRKVGTWVNWQDTVDQFLTGDYDLKVEGIAVSWMPTFINLKAALNANCNLFVSHEPLYATKVDSKGKVIGGTPYIDPHLRRLQEVILNKNDVWVQKQRWLDKTGMVVYRCHDFWDEFPQMGVHGAWADWLGFKSKPVAMRRYYQVHDIGKITLIELAQKILDKVKPLGQESVHVIGSLKKHVSRIGIGTGAITDYRAMHILGADVLLLTDDGTCLWESGQWSLDTGIPIIILNHATSEEPGMLTLTHYIQKQFPNVPVKHVPTGCIYKTVV